MWCFIVDSVPRDFEYIQNVTVGRFLRTSRVCLSEVCTIRSVRRDHDETTSSDWVYVCVLVALFPCFMWFEILVEPRLYKHARSSGLNLGLGTAKHGQKGRLRVRMLGLGFRNRGARNTFHSSYMQELCGACAI